MHQKPASARIKLTTPLNICKLFCFIIPKPSNISLGASLKSDAPVSLSVSAKGFLYPVMPRAEVCHRVMSRNQPAALESKGSWGMGEGGRDAVLGRLSKP